MNYQKPKYSLSGYEIYEKDTSRLNLELTCVCENEYPDKHTDFIKAFEEFLREKDYSFYS